MPIYNAYICRWINPQPLTTTVSIQPSELVMLGIARGGESGYRLAAYEITENSRRKKFIISEKLTVQAAIITPMAPASYLTDLDGNENSIVFVSSQYLPIFEPLNTDSYKTLADYVTTLPDGITATVLAAVPTTIQERVEIGGTVIPFAITGEKVIRTKLLARLVDIPVVSSVAVPETIGDVSIGN